MVPVSDLGAFQGAAGVETKVDHSGEVREAFSEYIQAVTPSDMGGADFELALSIVNQLALVPKLSDSYRSGVVVSGLPFPGESIEAHFAGRVGDCFNCSVNACVLFSGLNLPSRVWVIEGSDGLGGASHSVLEVWSVSREKWILLDPVNDCYFMGTTGPLSLMELRAFLVGGIQDQFRIVQGSTLLWKEEDVLKNYRMLISTCLLTQDNSWLSKENSTKRNTLAKWLLSFDSGISFGKLIYAVVNLRQVKYLIDDRMTEQVSGRLVSWSMLFCAVFTACVGFDSSLRGVRWCQGRWACRVSWFRSQDQLDP